MKEIVNPLDLSCATSTHDNRTFRINIQRLMCCGLADPLNWQAIPHPLNTCFRNQCHLDLSARNEVANANNDVGSNEGKSCSDPFHPTLQAGWYCSLAG